MDGIEKYLSGDVLRGDDFDEQEIERWYREEKEAYFSLYGGSDLENYPCSTLNQVVFFNKLAFRGKLKVLGLGSGYGHELDPLSSVIGSLTIVESSQRYSGHPTTLLHPRYVEARNDGDIDAPSSEFDLVTCFSVLHHIANVTKVFTELHRILRPGGVLLLREPMVSMGDWTKDRAGLTKNERGIALGYILNLIEKLRLTIIKKLYFGSPVMKLPGFSYNNKLHVYFDLFVSRILFFNYRYHPRRLIDKFRPTAVSLILMK